MWWQRGGAEKAAEAVDEMNDGGNLGESSGDPSDTANNIAGSSSMDISMPPKGLASETVAPERQPNENGNSRSGSGTGDDLARLDVKTRVPAFAINEPERSKTSIAQLEKDDGPTKHHHHYHYHHHHSHHHHQHERNDNESKKRPVEFASPPPKRVSKRSRHSDRSEETANHHNGWSTTTGSAPEIKSTIQKKVDRSSHDNNRTVAKQHPIGPAMAKDAASHKVTRHALHSVRRPHAANEMQEVAEALTSLARGADKNDASSQPDGGWSGNDAMASGQPRSRKKRSHHGSLPDSIETQTHIAGSAGSAGTKTIGGFVNQQQRPKLEDSNGVGSNQSPFQQMYGVPSGHSHMVQPSAVPSPAVLQVFHPHYFSPAAMPFLHHLPFRWSGSMDHSGREKQEENERINQQGRAKQSHFSGDMGGSSYGVEQSNFNSPTDGFASFPRDVAEMHQAWINQYQQFQQFQRYQQTATAQNVAAMMNMMTAGVPPAPGSWSYQTIGSSSSPWMMDPAHQQQATTMSTGGGTETYRLASPVHSLGLSGMTGMPSHSRESVRRQAIQKYREKRKARDAGLGASKKIRYQSRKILADARPRVRGQFVKAIKPGDGEATSKAKPLPVSVLAEDDDGDDHIIPSAEGNRNFVGDHSNSMMDGTQHAHGNELSESAMGKMSCGRGATAVTTAAVVEEVPHKRFTRSASRKQGSQAHSSDMHEDKVPHARGRLRGLISNDASAYRNAKPMGVTPEIGAKTGRSDSGSNSPVDDDGDKP